MSRIVRVYRLSARFVDERDAPPEIEQLKLYTLALGHHIGVVDCLSPVLSVPAEDFFQMVCRLPDGPARKKLDGLATWGEIEIRRGHARVLLAAMSGAAEEVQEAGQWVRDFVSTLQTVERTPAAYLVVRMSEGPSDHRR